MALVNEKKAFKQFYKPFVTKVNSTKQKCNDMDYTFWNTLIKSVLVVRPNTITKGKYWELIRDKTLISKHNNI